VPRRRIGVRSVLWDRSSTEVAISLGRKAIGIELQVEIFPSCTTKLFLSPNGKEKTAVQAPANRRTRAVTSSASGLARGFFPWSGLDVKALRHGSCPFLSDVFRGRNGLCQEREFQGVCTISSASNGPRQDWLVCPYRVIDTEIVTGACERIFGSKLSARPTAASLLESSRVRGSFRKQVAKTGVGYLFFQDKLGGEISVLGTAKSPEIAF